MQESTGISPVNPVGHDTGPLPVVGALVGFLVGDVVGGGGGGGFESQVT